MISRFVANRRDAEPIEIDGERFMAMFRHHWTLCGPGVGSSWRRVVLGCDILIDNCCDPDLDHLEWRPDVKRFLESQEQQTAETAKKAKSI